MNLRAQDSQPLSSDRPGQAFTPWTLGKGYFQIQTGFQIDRLNSQNTDAETRGFLIPFYLRVGLSDRLEFNLDLNYRRNRVYLNDVELSDLNGLSDSKLGFRVNLRKGSSFLDPTMAVLINIRFNEFLSSDWKRNFTAPTFTFTSNHIINNNSSLTFNFGGNWTGFNLAPLEWNYVFSYSYSVTQSWGFLVEHYGTFIDDLYFYNFDAGVFYLINNDLQLDINGGGGQGEDTGNYFFNAGVTYRFSVQGQ